MKHIRRTFAILSLAMIGFIAWRTATASSTPGLFEADMALLQHVRATRHDVAFNGRPLGQVTVLLSERYGVRVSHEFESVGEASVDAMIPVNASASNARVTEILQQIRSVALRNGGFVLTTPNVASGEARFTRIFDGTQDEIREACKRVETSNGETWRDAINVPSGSPDQITRIGDLYIVRGPAFAHFLLHIALEDIKSGNAPSASPDSH